MEHRCCIEFLNIKGKLVFDGSIENLDSLIQHEEYKAITNKAVLDNVTPLLMVDRDRRSYRRRSGVTQRVGDFQFASVQTKKSKHIKLV